MSFASIVDAEQLHAAVEWTGRGSALLFAAALLVPAFFDVGARRSRRVYVAFLLAHGVHFAVVSWFASVSGGANLFPGGRSLADVGGWPTLFAIVAFFYALAFVVGFRRHAGLRASRALRGVSRAATLFIGVMFVGTYLPLVGRSAWFALPALLVTAALVADSIGPRVRELVCLSPHAGARAA